MGMSKGSLILSVGTALVAAIVGFVWFVSRKGGSKTPGSSSIPDVTDEGGLGDVKSEKSGSNKNDQSSGGSIVDLGLGSGLNISGHPESKTEKYRSDSSVFGDGRADNTSPVTPMVNTDEGPKRLSLVPGGSNVVNKDDLKRFVESMPPFRASVFDDKRVLTGDFLVWQYNIKEDTYIDAKGNIYKKGNGEGNISTIVESRGNHRLLVREGESFVGFWNPHKGYYFDLKGNEYSICHRDGKITLDDAIKGISKGDFEEMGVDVIRKNIGGCCGDLLKVPGLDNILISTKYGQVYETIKNEEGEVVDFVPLYPGSQRLEELSQE